MTSRLKFVLIFLLVLGLFAGLGYDSRAQAEEILQRVAETYGVQSFGKIDQIQYTFNAQIGDKLISRSWVWEPKADKVALKGSNNQESVTYKRIELNDSPPEHLKK